MKRMAVDNAILLLPGFLFALALLWIALDCGELRKRIARNEFAYAAGTTVQTTREGAMIYCHDQPTYLAIKHSAPMSALLRRYIEAECS